VASEQNSPSRRDLLKIAATTGAGLLLAGLTNRAEAATPASPEKSDFKPSKYTHKFDLKKLAPTVANAGGAIAICNEDNFPVVAGHGAAVFLLTLKPGSLREPHWHPNCWEIDVPLAGKSELIVVDPNDTVDTVVLEPGDIGFIPQGYAHSIQNVGNDDAVIAIVFNDSKPDDIGLSTMLGGLPKSQFAQTFGVPDATMAGIPKPKKTYFVAPKV